jgi:cysteine desulfurase
VIYLDHHAATPLCSAARAALQGALEADARATLGNPSSVHAAGRHARALLERGREQVARALGASPLDIVLTSGGTESCNLGLHGALESPAGKHIVTTSIEHPAVATVIAQLERDGARVTRLALPGGVPPAVDQLAAAITPDTALVALQWINHETGTLLPIPEYAALCRERAVPLFVDATQAAGKVAIDLARVPVDLLAIASHKLGGPAGAGALFVRKGIDVDPQLLGGAQERGRRAGSPDLLAVVGFGAACEVIRERLDARLTLLALRERIERGLRELGFVINASDGPRAATAVNASLLGARGPELVMALDLEGVCVSSGAACSSGLAAPSPVLLAMHSEAPERASSALRFSLGPETTQADVDLALEALRKVLLRDGAGQSSIVSR